MCQAPPWKILSLLVFLSLFYLCVPVALQICFAVCVFHSVLMMSLVCFVVGSFLNSLSRAANQNKGKE